MPRGPVGEGLGQPDRPRDLVRHRPPRGPDRASALHDLERFLDTARVVMQRRGESLSAGSEQVLRTLWKQTAGRVA